MTDKEKIRAAIEKRYNYHKDHADDWAGAEHFWKADEDRDILSFIDSLQEEPVSEELEKVVEEIVDTTVLNAYGVKEIANRLRRTMIEPVSEDFENALAEEWKGYNDRGAAKVDALEDNTQELAFAKGFYRGWHYKKEEPVSDDLEEAAKRYATEGDEISGLYIIDEEVEAFKAGAKWQKTKDESTTKDLGDYINELSKQFPEVSFAKLSRIAIRVAKWQKQQDQSTIELAEDHAMLAGMEKMKEEMMEKAKSGTVQKDNQVILDDGTYMDLDPSMQLKPSFVGLKEGDRIKVIVIKED